MIRFNCHSNADEMCTMWYKWWQKREQGGKPNVLFDAVRNTEADELLEGGAAAAVATGKRPQSRRSHSHCRNPFITRGSDIISCSLAFSMTQFCVKSSYLNFWRHLQIGLTTHMKRTLMKEVFERERRIFSVRDWTKVPSTKYRALIN